MRRWLLGVALFAPAFAFAQDSKSAEAAATKSQKTTVINFEDDTIEGDLSRPDGEYVESIKRVNHSNLIRIREEYRDKVMQSVDEL